jgi:5-formyltetrahydrofolate cyclo-ligase
VPDFSDEAEALHRAKTAQRHAVLARRRALTPQQHAVAAGRVQAKLLELVRQLRPRLVAAYLPIGSEPGGPDLPEALHACLAYGGELLLPVLRADLDLDWAAYPGHGSLVATGRGMREPVGPRLGVTAIGAANLIVLPALAVDRHGVRLGRGGGSYDRALARVGPDSLTVALLHDGELIDALPAQPHDRPVRAVISPTAGLSTLLAN